MAAVTVISPTRFASLGLRQEWGRKGFINLRFIQLPVLAELLGSATLAGDDRRPLKPTLQSIYLGQVLSQAAGNLESVRDHPRTHASVRTSFRELRRASEDILIQLEAGGGVGAEIATLYRKYREGIKRDWYDPEDLLEAAVQAVEKGQAPALADLGHIIFFVPHSTSPGEAQLMLALARRGQCTVILGTTGDDMADEPVKSLANDLKAALGAQNAVVVAPPQDTTTDGPLPPGEVHLHQAPSAHEELRWVVRQIMAEATTKATPFHRMAVLYRAANPYGHLIKDELEAVGIPMAGPGRESLANSPVGRALLGMLKLAENTDFRRDEVMDWLTSCPIAPPNRRGGGFSPSQLDAVSRNAGVVGGLDQWKVRLETYAGERSDRADQLEQDGSISEAGAKTMRQSAGDALALSEFIQDLAQALAQPEGRTSWGAYCDWARGLLDHFLKRPNESDVTAAAERFDRDLDAITKILEEIQAADQLTSETSPEGVSQPIRVSTAEFIHVVRDALEAPQGPLGATGQGVFVADFSNAAAMDFDVVWMVGMIEGRVPPATRPDPLLPESTFGSQNRGSRSRQRIAAERFNYLSAASTAARRTLSYPLADSASQRQAHPSRWFLEQASALAGKQVNSNDLPGLLAHQWFTQTLSAEDAVRGLEDYQLADTQDFNLNRLIRWKDEEKRLWHHPLAAQGILDRAKRLGQGRRSRRFTVFDGNLSSAATGSRFARGLRNRPISPTRLEEWATCPFRYFLANVLRLGALDSPEDSISISPLERGTLVHEILDRFMRESVAQGLLPPAGQEWADADRSRLVEIAEGEFHNAETRGVAGKPLLWEIEKQKIRGDLVKFLEVEVGRRALIGTGQVLNEAPFGMGQDSPRVVDPATGISFRGKIDRVDISADGASVLVSDYKTGSSNYYSELAQDPIDKGKKLQLGVYSLAASLPGKRRHQGAGRLLVHLRNQRWEPGAQPAFRS